MTISSRDWKMTGQDHMTITGFITGISAQHRTKRFMTYLVARWLFSNKRLLLFVILPILILFPHIKCHRTHNDVTLWWLTRWWRHFFLTWFLVKWCLTGLVPTILCLKTKMSKISILLNFHSKLHFSKNGLFLEKFHFIFRKFTKITLVFPICLIA